jgi:4-amino-4-deoxy-L-arabinose transferase-like glycosyltransferase
MPWRSPQDQPGWARPVLLALAVASAALYGWRLNGNGLHPYYAPAVKSMSVSWKAFFYGGYDPAASITLDKLPGAFMVQALSARIFGFHTWSVILPQVIASVVTVLVLYRVVRRWRGPVAGIFAAAAYATMPIVAALARAQISDTLLVMLLVLAADAWQRAVGTARLRALLLCGVWVGLAFQTKMVQAWGVLPAFALVYLVAAPGMLRRRLAHVGLAGLVTAAVSMWWIVLVLLTPASSRPYVDGSTDNSPLSMVFGYNLLDRYRSGDGASLGGARMQGIDWGYLLGDGVAPQVGWLYPLALVGLVVGVWWRGRAARTDAVRAGFLMWGLWLAVHAAAFTTGAVAHVFYVVALAPAVAALAAGGMVTLWSAYGKAGWRRWMLPVTIAATVAWTAYMSQRFTDFLPWLTLTVGVVGAAAVIALVVAVLPGRRIRRAAVAGGALAVVSVLMVPAAWAASTVDYRYAGSAIGPSAGASGDFSGSPGGKGGPVVKIGPGIGPGVEMGPGGPDGQGPGGPSVAGGPAYYTGPGGPGGPGAPGGGMSDRPSPQVKAVLAYLDSQYRGEKYLVAAQGDQSAGELLLTGASVLPMGGFGGRAPFPTSDQLGQMVAQGQVRFVLLRTGGPDNTQLNDWVTGHCAVVDASAYGGDQPPDQTLYDCAQR